MRRILFGILIGLLLLPICSCGREKSNADTRAESPQTTEYPARIVSLAPSVTEVLFALGMGERVAGVTDFCNYPPEALKKPKIGGVMNPSTEAIIALDADLVIGLPSPTQESLYHSLRQLGIKVLALPNDTIAD